MLLPAIEDRDIWAYFASLAFPREPLVRATLEALAEHGPLSTAALETYVDLNRTRLETMLKVLDVDGAVRRVRGGWESTGQEWVYDEERHRRVREAREREQAAMLAYLDHDGCRMEYLRRQLDDPGAEPCGRCDRCGGFALSSDVSEAAVEAAEEQLSRPGVVLEPRKMWPTALVNLGLDLKGKIADGAEEGRVVARLTDLGHGGSLRTLFAADDGPVPVALARAVVDVLGDWKPRVEAIVHVESARRPTLTQRPRRGVVALPRRTRGGAVRDRRPDGRPRPWRLQLRAAGGRGEPPVRRAGGDPGRAGAARRRPRRDRVDDDDRRPRASRSRCHRGAAASARRQQLTPSSSSIVARLGPRSLRSFADTDSTPRITRSTLSLVSRARSFVDQPRSARAESSRG